MADATSTIQIVIEGSVRGITAAAGAAASAIGSITRGLGGLAAAGAGVQAIAGATAALTQLAPAAIIGVGALAALVAAKQTFAVATQGFADAIGGDAEALAGLAPSAREAANAFTALRDGPFKDLQQAVQQRFFEGFGEEIRQVGAAALPVLRTGMEGVSTALNGVGLELLAVGRNSFALSDLGSIFAGTTGFLTNARTAAADFLQGILALAGAGSQYLSGFGTALGDVGARFAEWARAAVESGDVFEWIDSAIAGFRDLGAIIGNVGSILGSVFGALAGDVSSPLAALADLTGRLREFFASAAAQGPLQALGETLRAVSSAFGDILLAALQAVLPLIQGLAPFVTALAEAFRDFAVGALGQLSGPLTQVVSQLAGALAPILPTLSAAFVQLAGALAPVINALAGPLASIISTIVLLFAQLVSALAPVIAALAPIVSLIGQALAEALQRIAPILVMVATTIAETLVAALNAIVPLLPPLIDAFLNLVDAALVLVPPLLDLAVATLPLFIGALQLVIPAVTAVANILAFLIPFLEMPIQTLANLTAAFSTMVGAVLATVGGWVTGLINFFTNVSQQGSTIIGNFVAAVGRFFTQMGDTVADVANAIYAVVSSQIGAMAASARAFVGDMVAAVVRFFNTMGTDAGAAVRRLVSDVVAAVGRLASDFATAAGRAVDGFVAGIRAGVGRVGQAARDLAASAWSALQSFFDFGSPSKLTRKGGRWVGQGLALGIGDSVDGIIASARTAAAAANEALLSAGPLTVTAQAVTGQLGAEQRVAAPATAADLQTAITAAMGSQQVAVTVLLDGEPVRAAVRAQIQGEQQELVRRATVGSGVSF